MQINIYAVECRRTVGPYRTIKEFMSESEANDYMQKLISEDPYANSGNPHRRNYYRITQRTLG